MFIDGNNMVTVAEREFRGEAADSEGGGGDGGAALPH